MDVVHHPGEHCVAPVVQAAFEGEFHELLACWAHVLEAPAERDDGESGVLEVLAHLGGAPPVEGDLADVEPGAELFDERLDGAIVDDVAVGDVDEAFPSPLVV